MVETSVIIFTHLECALRSIGCKMHETFSFAFTFVFTIVKVNIKVNATLIGQLMRTTCFERNEKNQCTRAGVDANNAKTPAGGVAL